MTVTAGATINPETILSGQAIRVFNTSYASGEVLIRSQAYVNQQLPFTANGTSVLSYTWAAGQCLYVGDTVLISPLLSPLAGGTTYWVVAASPTTFQISATKGGTAINVNAGAGGAYVGADTLYGMGGEYPELRPYPVTSAVSRNITIYAEGSLGGSAPHTATINIPFWTGVTASTKPLSSSIFGRFSIFIYSSTKATVANRFWTTNQGFIFTTLAFTGSINKAGTASFTIVGKGSQTADEESLLLSDNYVAIIVGESVVWSGKILRSEQNKMTLYNSASNVKTWDIECESDVSKMRFQNIVPANKGTYTGSIGYVVSKLVEGTGTSINWNGTTNDPGLRSNEGPDITYTITEADMFTQLTTLRNVIDFDLRTRLVYQRYYYTAYNGSTTITVSSISPYTSPYFVGKWVLFTIAGSVGVMSYGLCTSNPSSTSIVCNPIVNPSLPTGTGTIIILGDPVLDLVSDLSQPSKQATFYMNAPRLSTPSFGYEFDDKTDRKLLATKVVAKGKSSGVTITKSISAVTPWNQSKGSFDDSTTITSRTEGTVIAVTTVSSGLDAGIYWTLEGWGYPSTGTMYWAMKTASGVWRDPSSLSYIQNTTPPVETYLGTRRVTVFRTLYTSSGGSYINVGDLMIYTTATVLTPPYYGYYYVDSTVNLSYTAGMDIYIGGETITTDTISLDPVRGYRIRYMLDGTAKHREAASEFTTSHSTGSIVWRGSIYSETSPVTGSPVAYHGTILKTYTVDTDVTPSTLELYATMCLIAYSYYYRKASFWCPVYDFFKTDSREQYQLTAASFLGPGDRIACLPKSTDLETDTLYGQLKNIWQIVSFTVDTNTMQVTVDLGDFERNVFTLLVDKTSAINETIT